MYEAKYERWVRRKSLKEKQTNVLRKENVWKIIFNVQKKKMVEMKKKKKNCSKKSDVIEKSGNT